MTSVVDFDPLGPAMMEDPYPVYAELQRKHPVFWQEQVRAWIITRYDDCRDILMDGESYVRDPRRISEPSKDASASVQTLAAENQTELRRLLIGSMHAQDLPQLGRNVRARIDEVFARVMSRPSFDWITEVAAPLAGGITAELLGVSEPDPRVFQAVAEGMALKFDEDLGEENSEAASKVQAAIDGFAVIIDEWLASDETHGTILTIKNTKGEDVQKPYEPPAGKQVISPQAAYIVTDILAGNTNKNINPFWGKFAITGPDGRRPATLKTGTNNDAKDLNAYGYIAPPTDAGRKDGAYALAVGVWNGNSDNSLVSTAAAPLFSIDVSTFVWQGFLDKVTEKWAVNGFKRPDGLVEKTVDPFTGVLALPGGRKTTELYLADGPQPVSVGADSSCGEAILRSAESGRREAVRYRV